LQTSSLHSFPLIFFLFFQLAVFISEFHWPGNSFTYIRVTSSHWYSLSPNSRPNLMAIEAQVTLSFCNPSCPREDTHFKPCDLRICDYKSQMKEEKRWNLRIRMRCCLLESRLHETLHSLRSHHTWPLLAHTSVNRIPEQSAAHDLSIKMI
jgi:hypothetical protein